MFISNYFSVFIEFDLSNLDVGHSIHVSALTLPPGVSLVLRGKLDPVVAAAVVPKAIVEEVVEVEAVPGAEAGAVAGAAVPGAPGAEAKPAEEAGGDKKDAGKGKDKDKDDKKKK